MSRLDWKPKTAVDDAWFSSSFAGDSRQRRVKRFVTVPSVSSQ